MCPSRIVSHVRSHPMLCLSCGRRRKKGGGVIHPTAMGHGPWAMGHGPWMQDRLSPVGGRGGEKVKQKGNTRRSVGMVHASPPTQWALDVLRVVVFGGVIVLDGFTSTATNCCQLLPTATAINYYKLPPPAVSHWLHRSCRLCLLLGGSWLSCMAAIGPSRRTRAWLGHWSSPFCLGQRICADAGSRKQEAGSSGGCSPAVTT